MIVAGDLLKRDHQLRTVCKPEQNNANYFKHIIQYLDVNSDASTADVYLHVSVINNSNIPSSIRYYNKQDYRLDRTKIFCGNI